MQKPPGGVQMPQLELQQTSPGLHTALPQIAESFTGRLSGLFALHSSLQGIISALPRTDPAQASEAKMRRRPGRIVTGAILMALGVGAAIGGAASAAGENTIDDEETPVPYTPNPAAITSPAEDFQRLVMTAKVWRPLRIEMHETFATLIYVTQNRPHSLTVPFKEVVKVEVLTSGEDYILRAKDAAGANIYEYVSINQKNAQDLADVFAALSGAKAPEPAPAPASGAATP